jgi:hypothetical protein
MNMNENPSPEAPGLGWSPRWFLVGLLAGLVACAIIARVVAARGYHREFTRFHVRISPEAQYYPTLEEMRGIVRSRCRPDQVLVIVGGNSIFHGVGQPAGKIWTQELQRQLGDGYMVINFAFRGALCTDGGAVLAEVLRDEFPRQIYIANIAPFIEPAPYGHEPYRYLFKDARHRGLLIREPRREKHVADFERATQSVAVRYETKGVRTLDQVLRFHDLWNWVGYNWLFTIPNPKTPDWPQAIWARKRLADEENDFDELMSPNERFGPATLAAEMAIVRGFTQLYYKKSAQGQWVLEEATKAQFMNVARLAFPDQLKARTLIMLSRNCPFYVRLLEPDEKLREELAYQDSVAAWQEAGYRSAQYGMDFLDSDYGDRTHLTVSGGVKLAGIVAAETRAMALKLGYIKESSP